MRKFEGSSCVIVQSPHQPVIARVGHTRRIESRRYCRKVRFGCFIQRIRNHRQRLNNRLIRRNLAVQHAQRVGHRAPLAIHTHLAHHRHQCRAQRLVVPRPIRRGSNGVQLQRPAGNAQLVQQRCQHLQHLGVTQRALAPSRRRSNHFGPNLRKLTIPPLLRPLPPELRPHVVELLQLPALAQPMLDIRAHHPRGILRPQRQHLRLLALGPRLVLPGIHLLRNNVGFLAHPARKQRRVFKNGGSDFAKVVAGKHLPRRLLNVVPERRFRWQQISRAAYGFQCAHNLNSVSKMSIASGTPSAPILDGR